MTNNHCPDIPAVIQVTDKTENDILQFATSIMNQITDFAHDQSMDEMLVIDPRIVDNWSECPRCESRVCNAQHLAYGKVIKKVMKFLDSEL